jgi:hypothetical protein
MSFYHASKIIFGDKKSGKMVSSGSEKIPSLRNLRKGCGVENLLGIKESLLVIIESFLGLINL